MTRLHSISLITLVVLVSLGSVAVRAADDDYSVGLEKAIASLSKNTATKGSPDRARVDFLLSLAKQEAMALVAPGAPFFDFEGYKGPYSNDRAFLALKSMRLTHDQRKPAQENADQGSVTPFLNRKAPSGTPEELFFLDPKKGIRRRELSHLAPVRTFRELEEIVEGLQKPAKVNGTLFKEGWRVWIDLWVRVDRSGTKPFIFVSGTPDGPALKESRRIVESYMAVENEALETSWKEAQRSANPSEYKLSPEDGPLILMKGKGVEWQLMRRSADTIFGNCFVLTMPITK
jgi:hypothetical protein